MDCRFSVPVLALAGVVAIALGPGALAGISQVRVAVELGWQGEAVAGVVNPLQITVENGSGAVVIGTLIIEQTRGSGWRGESVLRLEAPVLLPPGGRRRFVFPWPVDLGSPPLAITVRSSDALLARATAEVRARVARGVAVVGRADPGDGAFPVLFLAPGDVPEDPRLLAPWAEVRLGLGTVLSSTARDAVQAWVAYGGGVVEGVGSPPTWPGPTDADLEAEVERRLPRPAPAGGILGAAVVYLLALGYVLPQLSRRGGHRGMVAFALVCLGLALLYPLLYMEPHHRTIVQYSMTRSDVSGFGLDTLTMRSRHEGVAELAGHWMERPRAGMGSAIRRLEWVWGDEGVRTFVHLEQGQTAILWTYGRPWDGAEAMWVQDVGRGIAPDPAVLGWGPALAVIRRIADEGDRIMGCLTEERRGDEGWTVYRLRWERDG